MEPGILDTILDEFQGALNVAIPFLQGDAGFLFQAFLVITIALAGAAYAFGDNSAGLHFLLKKVLLIGFTLFLIQNWLFLTNVIVNSFGILGLRAGGIAGVTLTTADFFFPSRIVDLGFGIAEQIFDQINVASSLFRFNLGDVAVALLAGLIMGLAFIIIALQVFMALIEFKIVTLGGFILLPFAILDRTTSLAERALGYVIAAGLKIFALAVVVSFAFAILPSLELSEELTLTEAFMVGTDKTGAAGLEDRVDYHIPGLVGAVLLSSIIGAGANLATDSSADGSFIDDLGNAAAQQAASVGSDIVRRQLDIQPTITIRPGFRLNILVGKDIVLEPYR